jgi:hypothetical protein
MMAMIMQTATFLIRLIHPMMATIKVTAGMSGILSYPTMAMMKARMRVGSSQPMLAMISGTH